MSVYVPSPYSYRSLLQNIVSFIGLFRSRDLSFFANKFATYQLICHLPFGDKKYTNICLIYCLCMYVCMVYIYISIYISVLQCVAVCCSMLQYVAVRCSVCMCGVYIYF